MREIAVVLQDVRSLHNVGSVFRTADAAGVSKIYLCGITPKPVDVFGKYRNEISKVALGAEKTIPWEHSKSAITVLKKLKKAGYRIFAVEQSRKSIPYYEFRLCSRHSHGVRVVRVALVLGSEVKGLPKSVLNAADKILEIPMYGTKESLNVSVAFGVVVFRLREKL